MSSDTGTETTNITTPDNDNRTGGGGGGGGGDQRAGFQLMKSVQLTLGKKL